MPLLPIVISAFWIGMARQTAEFWLKGRLP